MRALRWHAPGDLRLEEVADPEPHPGEVLVRVEVALTDGTDRKAFLACVVDAGGRPLLVGGRPERRALAPLFGAIAGDGRGADVAIEATGSAEGWRDAVALVRPGGTAVFFSGLPAGTEVALDASRIHYEALTLRGVFHHTPRTVRAALAFLASGARPWERLITHEVGLEGVAGLLADPPRDYLKAVVRC